MYRTGTLLLFIGFLTCSAAGQRVLGGPCDGCETVFEGMPTKLESRARIAPPGEPGEPLAIEGTVRSLDGEPAAGIVVYAYHTDATGVYPLGSTRHGRLRGWVQTAADGTYRFDTIRPGSYPDRDIPQHIHVQVIEPDKGTYYVDDILFRDDPLLTPKHERLHTGRGGAGIVRPRKSADGSWHVRRDLTLGKNIRDYP